MTTKRWSSDDADFWEAVLIVGADYDSDEDETIQAALLLQEILLLAQDALTRPTDQQTTNGGSTSQTMAAVVPPRVIQKPRTGDVVTAERAVELFAEGWILRPIAPDKTSTLSPLRDYRVFQGQIEFNSSYPPKWESSAGTITDSAEWIVIFHQDPTSPIGQPAAGRPSGRVNRAS